jgi:hypothetical protein
MRFTKLTWIRAVVASAALLGLSAVLPTPALRADAVQDQVDAMKGFEKTGDDVKCIAKMQEAMKDSFGDTRVLKAVKDFIGSKNDKIACAAVKAIAGLKVKDLEFLKWICAKFDHKNDLFKEKDKGGNPELLCAFLDAVVQYQADKGSQATIKAAIPKFADIVKFHLSTNPEFTTRAIRAYGCVRDRFTMEQMLDWGEQIENAAGKSGGATGGGKKGMSQETRDNQDKAKKAIIEVMAEMTGKDAGADVAAWRKWWTENGKTFAFPVPADPSDPAASAAPVAGASVPKGTEFKDDVYGYTVTRPDADGWKFVKADFDEPRMAMDCVSPDDPNYIESRTYFSILNTAKYPPKDVKGMVEWIIATPIKEEIDAHDKAPEVKETKLGGVDWTVVTVKGEAIGRKSGFGTIERRFYVTKFDAYILRVDGFVRSGAEEEVKTALWKSLETITVPAAKK